MSKRVCNELDCGMKTKFVTNLFTVPANGFFADVKFNGDLFARVSITNEFEHLYFSLGQSSAINRG
jgi:hypothetical protein